MSERSARNPDYTNRHPNAETDVDRSHAMALASNERRTHARMMRQGARLAIEASRYEQARHGSADRSDAFDYIAYQAQREQRLERGLIEEDIDAAQNISRGHGHRLTTENDRQAIETHYDSIANQIDEQADRLEQAVATDDKPE